MIFLDSSYIKGLILKNDDYNHLSKRIKPYLKHEAKVINTTVLVEVANSIKHGNYERDVSELLTCLKTLDVFDFLPWEDYESSLDWFNYFDSASTFQIALSSTQWLSIMFKELSHSIRISIRLTVLKGFIE